MKYHSSGKGIPPEFSKLTWRELETISKYYNRLAVNLKKRAKYNKALQNMNKEALERVDILADSYKSVLNYLDQGSPSLEKSIADTAKDMKVEYECILAWWKIFIKNKEQKAREERNKVIINLVKMGLTNEVISRRFRIHKNTVSRAITESLHGSLRPVDRARLRKRRKVKPKP